MSDKLNIDELLNKVNIVDVVNQYVSLKKRGTNYVGLCPFHNDRNPSFTVNDRKQIFKCFVCDIGGNAVKFISLVEHVGYLDAAFKIADMYGIKYDKGSPERQETNRLAKEIKSLNKEVAKYYFENLKKSPEAIEYLKKRGLSAQTATKFGIGYSSDSWSDMYNHFHNTGISDDLLNAAGLITISDKNGEKKVNDKFRGRLMFPIFSENGEVIAFGGRVIDPESKMAKYINTQETAAYSKGKHLYGYNVAKATKQDMLIVVEGYMDCIALHSKGIDFAVASLGTALTEKQARLIKSKFKKVILAYDNDSAGKAATIRGMEILKAEGLDVRIFRLQGAKDADEYLRTHTKEEFINQLNKSFSLTEYKIMLAAEDYPADSNENTIRFINQIKRIFKTLPETDQYIYSKWIEDNYGSRYGISKEAFYVSSKETEASNENEQKPRRIYVTENQKTNSDESQAKQNRIEKTLIVVLAENSNAIKKLPELSDSIFTLEENKKIYARLLENLARGTLTSAQCLFDGTAADNEITEILFDFNVKPEQALSSAKELIHKIKLNPIIREINEISGKLASNELSAEQKRPYYQKLMELNNMKKQLERAT